MKIWIVIRKEYLERVRSKSFVIGTLLGPALMSMFIVVPLLLEGSGGEEARTVGVIDPAGRYVEPLRQALHERDDTHVTLLPISVQGRSATDAVADLKQMLLDESVNAGVLIGENFLTDRQATFYSRSVSSMVMRDQVLRPALNRVLRRFRFQQAAVPESLQSYLTASTAWTSISVSPAGEEAEQNEDAVFIVAVALIMILYMMVLIYGGHTLTAVIEEKSSRVVEVLLSSLSPSTLMRGKVLGIGLAGLTQFAVWTLAFFFLSLQGVSLGGFTFQAGFLSPTVLVSFLIFFLLGFFLYATLYAGVGAMCNTVQDSQQFHMPLVMGLVIPMLMLSFVLRAPDSTVSVVLSLVPFFAPVLMFMRICVQTPPFWQIGVSWVLLVLSIWLAGKAAGKLFRLGILMHGSSPTWVTLGRALRQS